MFATFREKFCYQEDPNFGDFCRTILDLRYTHLFLGPEFHLQFYAKSKIRTMGTERGF